VGFIGSILGKREPEIVFRTIDGGHPAPYPDMTDEQLYNYEMTFNVPHKTFDKPPASHQGAAQSAWAEHAAEELDENDAQNEKPDDKLFDAPRYSARAARDEQKEPPQAPASGELPPLDLTKPVRLVTSKQAVEIITTRARHPVYKVHGYIGDDNVVTVFTLDGQLSENGPRFLENVPEQRQLYLNIYLNPDRRSADKYVVTQHATEEEADAAAMLGRVASVGVQIAL
jgi:hypothetical protein